MHRLSCVGRLTAIERGVQGLQLVDLEHAPLERGSILCLLSIDKSISKEYLRCGT